MKTLIVILMAVCLVGCATHKAEVFPYGKNPVPENSGVIVRFPLTK